MSNPFRVLVTGSRDWTDRNTVWVALDVLTEEASWMDRPLVVVHGGCPSGADKIASFWARQTGSLSPSWATEEAHPAQNHPTEDFGPWPGCGPRRNAFMVNQDIDTCLAFIGYCTSRRCHRQSEPHPSHGAYGCALAAYKAGIVVTTYSLNGLDVTL